MKKIKIAVLYVRSNEDEHYKQTNSTSNQYFILKEYCSKNDIAVLQTFEDIHSGEDFNRTGFNKMLSYVEKHKDSINMILFTTRDRFRSENAQENNKMVAHFMKMEIEPKALENPYFLDSNSDEEMKKWFNHYKNL